MYVFHLNIDEEKEETNIDFTKVQVLNLIA